MLSLYYVQSHADEPTFDLIKVDRFDIINLNNSQSVVSVK